MIIGTAKLDMRICTDPGSLKDKRRIINSIKAKLKNKFECLCAEVDLLDKWDEAVLGIAHISNNKKFTNGVISKIIDYMDKNPEVEVRGVETEFINL